MEGNAQPSMLRLAAYAHTHPEAQICRVEGIWHAWLPVGDNGGGFEMHGRTACELLGKLEGVA